MIHLSKQIAVGTSQPQIISITVQEPVSHVQLIKDQLTQTLSDAADDLVKSLTARRQDPIVPGLGRDVIKAMRLSEVDVFIENSIVIPTMPGVFELVAQYNASTDPPHHIEMPPIDTWRLSNQVLDRFDKGLSFRSLLEKPYASIRNLKIQEHLAYQLTIRTTDGFSRILTVPIDAMPLEFCADYSGKAMTSPSTLTCTKNSKCTPYTANHDEGPPFCPCGGELERTDRADIREKMELWIFEGLEKQSLLTDREESPKILKLDVL